jgi:hypothetical protein
LFQLLKVATVSSGANTGRQRRKKKIGCEERKQARIIGSREAHGFLVLQESQNTAF